jgi:hypothetical protein
MTYLSLVKTSKFKVSLLDKIIPQTSKDMIYQLTRQFLSASEIIIVVLSAMRTGFKTAFIVGRRSLLYTRERRGPAIKLCGTIRYTLSQFKQCHYV